VRSVSFFVCIGIQKQNEWTAFVPHHGTFFKTTTYLFLLNFGPGAPDTRFYLDSAKPQKAHILQVITMMITGRQCLQISVVAIAVSSGIFSS
jgi:hypothetical protein